MRWLSNNLKRLELHIGNNNLGENTENLKYLVKGLK